MQSEKSPVSSLLLSSDLTLVVGDVHIGPNQNLRRADWLGWAIRSLKPQRVVFIGDLMTFDCVSDWDKDKRKKMEGRRYVKDIESGKEFLDRMHLANKQEHSPDYILLEGNHEDRLRRYLDRDPTMDGAINYIRDLGIDSWFTVPYKEYFIHKGAYFTHVPITANGKAITGANVCAKALQIHQHSVIFGHTHKLGVESVHRHGSKHLCHAVNVGCYFEHVDEYAIGAANSYWRGLVLIDHYKQGRFNPIPISMGKLERAYNDSV